MNKLIERSELRDIYEKVEAGQRITEKNLNIQPTLTIRPGWPVRIIVQKDLILKPYRGD